MPTNNTGDPPQQQQQLPQPPRSATHRAARLGAPGTVHEYPVATYVIELQLMELPHHAWHFTMKALHDGLAHARTFAASAWRSVSFKSQCQSWHSA
jgi:hypothetical protein